MIEKKSVVDSRAVKQRQRTDHQSACKAMQAQYIWYLMNKRKSFLIIHGAQMSSHGEDLNAKVVSKLAT
eukprot:6210836-Pleurochrysis_carterae.AAC.2